MTTVREQAAGARGPQQKKMKVAVAGLGAGAVQVVRAMENAPYLELVAAADVRPQALETFKERYGGRTYDSVEKLCADPDVDVVWVSTPNQFHCEHTVIAAEHGKHVVVEKPVAISLEEAARMVAAVDKNHTKLLCGHTASLIAGIRAMRRVIVSGELGRLCAVKVWSFSDWMFRPRMPQDAPGGGPSSGWRHTLSPGAPSDRHRPPSWRRHGEEHPRDVGTVDALPARARLLLSLSGV